MAHQEKGGMRSVKILPKFLQLGVNGVRFEQAAAE